MRGIKMMENDYELIYLAQENDEFAQNFLINKYKYIIDILVNKYLMSIKSLKLEKDDLYNIGLFGLIEAINGFNSDDSSFASFATTIINNKITTYLRRNSRKKDSIFINSVSLNDNILEELSLKTPDNLIASEESYQELEQQIYNELTALEKSVYSLLTDFSPKEISKILNINTKKARNAISRIQSKTQKVLANLEKLWYIINKHESVFLIYV